MAETVVGKTQLQARLHAIGSQGSAGIMNQLGLRVVREAKLIVPRRTGNLGRSIRVIEHSATHVIVGATAGYAAYVELGTRAHEITPKVAKVLAWGGARRLTGSLRKGASATNFAMRVHHPGTKPHPYLVPGAKIAVQTAGVDAIVQAWNSAK